MSILSSTLGCIAPRYRLLSDWCAIYDEIIASRPLCAKTLANRRINVRHLCTAFAGRTIGSIRPHEVAAAIKEKQGIHPFTARRVLIEARDVFAEAVNYRWIDSNPAAAVRQPAARIRRRRLSLEQWRRAHAHSVACGQPWVRHLLMLALVTGQRRADLQRLGPADVWNGRLYVEQQKTGARIAIPLALSLDAIGVSLEDAINACADYAQPGDTFLRRRNGAPLVSGSLSARFQEAFEGGCGRWDGPGAPPSLHECRSLSERLYRAQGIDTRTLLGHRRQSQTDAYNDDRGLTRGQWLELRLPS